MCRASFGHSQGMQLLGQLPALLLQRSATATAKGKDALSRLKTLAHPSCKQQWSWPLVLAQPGAPFLFLHSPVISLNSTHPQGSEILRFLCL